MDFSDVVAIVSLCVGGASIALAVGAFYFSYVISKETKATLAEISKEAAVIKEVTGNSQQELLRTVTSIANPTPPTAEERLLQSIAGNPTSLLEMFRFAQEMGPTENQGTDENNTDG